GRACFHGGRLRKRRRGASPCVPLCVPCPQRGSWLACPWLGAATAGCCRPAAPSAGPCAGDEHPPGMPATPPSLPHVRNVGCLYSDLTQLRPPLTTVLGLFEGPKNVFPFACFSAFIW